ncbi:MAG: hypothetical protein F6K03_10615 [Kamptonema sp. SIO4C4]|nr:hypothetical protein [Kamptonema sp. SIO4C4]
MNSNFSRLAQINLSGIGCWLTVLLVFMLLSAAGFGWLVNGIFIVFLLLLLAPFAAILVLRWWVSRNLVEDQCPVCDYTFTGFNNVDVRCPSCGEPLTVAENQFKRQTPPGTIDVDAETIEVDVKQLED